MLINFVNGQRLTNLNFKTSINYVFLSSYIFELKY